MTLNTAERNSLRLLLLSLAGDPDAIDILFSRGATAFTFYVNPSAPASSTSFNTIQAAINAATPGQFTQIYLPPATVFNENITFPAGAFIEIITPIQTGFGVSVITGTVTDSGSSIQMAVGFTNTYVTGSITLRASAPFSFLSLRGSQVSGPISAPSMTVWVYGHLPPQSLQAGAYSTTVAPVVDMAGVISASRLLIGQGVRVSGNLTAIFTLLSDAVLACATVTGNLDVLRSAAQAVVAVTGAVRADGFSMGQLIAAGVTATGGLTLLDSGPTVPLTAFAGNVAATGIQVATPPVGMYEVRGIMLRTANGTTGTAVLNVSGTDEAGAFTIPLCSFDIASGVVRASGSAIIRSTGAANLTYSITGIVTPGALAAQLEIKLRKL
jgi:hypothetical protein